MKFLAVLHKLVLAIVAHLANFTFVRLVLVVTTRVVVAITDSCEALGAMFTFIRFFTCVSTHVNLQITSLMEEFSTDLAGKRLFASKTHFVPNDATFAPGWGSELCVLANMF